MDKNVIFRILSVVQTENKFFWTCSFLQMIKNSLNCLNLQYKKIWKILKLKKWSKMSFFAYWRSSKCEINFSWTCGFLQIIENSLNWLNLQYKKIWKILKLKKWTKTSNLTTYPGFSGKPDFFRKIGLRH